MQPHIFPEIYVRNVDATAKIFVTLFAAEVDAQDDFAEVRIGATRLLLNALNLDEFEQRNPIRQPGSLEHLGAGLELGVMVTDLRAVHDKAQQLDLPYITPIKTQAWGLTDFRLLLPDGHYVRVTDSGVAS